MRIAYARVSTDKQDGENQKSEIDRYAKLQGLTIDEYVAETISSGEADREIFAVVKGLREGDTIIATEISRFARSTVEFLDIINTLIAKKVRVIFIKENFDIRDDNPFAMFTITILASVAELDRKMIRMRTKAAIQSKRDTAATNGTEFQIGRRLGSKNKSRKLDGKEALINSYLAKKLNKTAIAKLLGVSRDVLYDKLAEMKPAD